MINSTDSVEKTKFSSKLIFLGLIFLFLGNGQNIQIAGNAPLFIVATVCNALTLVLFDKKIHSNYITYCLMILLVFNVIYWGIGTYDHGIAMGLFLNLLLIITTMNTMNSNKDIKIIIDGVIYSSVIFGILLLLYGKGYSGAIYDKMTYTQTFGNHIEFEPNFLALVLITGFEFCVWAVIKSIDFRKRKNVILYSIFAAITLLSSLMTGSRSVLITACIYGVLLILFMKNHKTRNKLLFVILLLIIVLIIAIQKGVFSQDIYKRLFENSYNDNSNGRRFENWQYGLKVMMDKPFGAGPFESSIILYTLYGYHNAAHNTFVAFGTYFGFLGVIAFAALPIGLAISAWKLKQRELFAMIISMIFEWNVLECQHTLSMWIFLLICILIINRLKQGKEINIF